MPNISIDRRYWVEDSVPRAWPPGADVFTGENNPKANYALDLNIDGQTMTFIPSSTINNGVYDPFSEKSMGRVGVNSYYMPWFLNQENQQKLAEVGKKVDLSKSDVGSYLKDKMGASTDGFLIPKGSLPFDSQIVSAPGKVQGMGSINGQPVYINEDINKTGQTYFTDASGQTKSYVPGSDGGGLFGGFLGDLMENPLVNAAANIAASYYGGPLGSAALQLAQGKSPEDALKAAAITYVAQQAPGGSPELTGTDAAMADLAGSTPAFTGAAPAAAGTTLADVATGGGAAAGNADKAALLGDAGYGAGMTGAETAAFDKGLAAGAGGAAAELGGAGTGGTAAGLAGGAAASNTLNTITGTPLGDMALISGGTGLIGAKLTSDAAQKAADTQTAAANAAIAQQQKNFETISQQQAPYRASGYNALNEIAKLSSGQTPQYDYLGNIVKDANGNPVMQAGSGYLTKQFTPQDFAAGIDPGYAFRLQQGQMANQRAANVAGGALSGNTLKGLQDYTQGLASTEYGNAFNRYQTQRQNIYNTLASIAGIGQTGQTATNQAATNATNAATQLGVGSAAAQAAGGVGSAQAYTNAINNAANNYTLASLLNQRGNVAMPVGS